MYSMMNILLAVVDILLPLKSSLASHQIFEKIVNGIHLQSPSN